MCSPQNPVGRGKAPGGAGPPPPAVAGPAAEPGERCSDRAGLTRPPLGWSGCTPLPPADTAEISVCADQLSISKMVKLLLLWKCFCGCVCWEYVLGINHPLCDLSHIFFVFPAWKHVCEGERLQTGMNQVRLLLFLLVCLCRRKPASNTRVQIFLLQEGLEKQQNCLFSRCWRSKLVLELPEPVFKVVTWLELRPT